MKETFLALCITLAAGCRSVNIQTTKQWEGHYYTIEEFKKATENMQLDKKESVWVLSNKTLNRVLKNTER